MVKNGKYITRNNAVIIKNENKNWYWVKSFSDLSVYEDIMLRACFKELKEKGLIDVKWVNNLSYILIVLREGYLCNQNFEEANFKSKFGKEITNQMRFFIGKTEVDKK